MAALITSICFCFVFFSCLQLGQNEPSEEVIEFIALEQSFSAIQKAASMFFPYLLFNHQVFLHVRWLLMFRFPNSLLQAKKIRNLRSQR